MTYSTAWRGKTSLVTMDITDDKGQYTGIVQLSQYGIRSGPWSGGRYGIGTEWKTLDKAIVELCIYMICEMENYTYDAILMDNLAHGKYRSEKAAIERKEKYSLEVEIDNTIQGLESWSELLSESAKEIEAGNQLSLF